MSVRQAVHQVFDAWLDCEQLVVDSEVNVQVVPDDVRK